MARSEKVVCDKCGAVRGESNHWFVVIYFADYAASAIVPAERWEEFRERIDEPIQDIVYRWKDACGMEHALQLQSEALAAADQRRTA
jgi:hypothetical protein